LGDILDLREEVTGDWRKLHNGRLHNLYSLHVIRIIRLRRMISAVHVAHTEEKNNACTILMQKPEGKRPLARPRRR
jgi:hypothetical protein